jgi:selenide,water dikinase
VLSKLPKPSHPDLLVGVNTVDDAGVFRISDEMALVQTVDFFTPIVDDPYTFGAIAAANSLSDIYAMGAQPLTALNIVCFPRKTVGLDQLSDILRGGYDKATEAGCLIIGGHSVEDNEMKYGLAVTGRVHPEKILTNANAKPGDALVLTKAIGTGIIATALKLGEIDPQEYEEVVQSMLSLNHTAARLAVEFGANACTDITGFGLMGHAWELASGSNTGLIIEAGKVPLLSNVLSYAERGFLTRGDRSNREYIGENFELPAELDVNVARALFDPQTSGGLLVSLPSRSAEAFVAALREAEVKRSMIIGKVTEDHPGQIRVIA